MPLDPQAQQILDEGKASGLPPVYHLSVEKARDRLTAAFSTKGEPEPVFKVENTKIPGPVFEIPLRIYYPNSNVGIPILVFFHGGGWTVNNLETHDGICRSLTNDAQCIVVSVDYRLAPEHKFPAAIEDAYIATQWVSNNAASIGGDANRIAVGGDSSGGTQATVVCAMARDRGGPAISFQWLGYSPTDYYLPGSPSYTELATGYSMNRDWMIWFWNHYLPSDIDVNNPYISPLRSPDLTGLPPAFIMTAEYDPLRDEGEAYAKKLKDAGVKVIHKRYEGMMHGFLLQRHRIDVAKKAYNDLIANLRSALRIE
jgi:acetyl esterase